MSEGLASVASGERVSGEPSWLEPTFNLKAGADPLGQQTVTTDRIIGRLLPGVLALSERARYISFYSWLLATYADQRLAPSSAQLSRYIKEREFEFAVAARLCPRGCGSSPIGANSASRWFVQTTDPYPRRESVESHLGGYGLYYATPMRVLGLIAPAGTLLGDEPTRIDVLQPSSEHATALAAAFHEAVADTEYVRSYMASSEPIPRDVLVEYSERACLCRLEDHVAERDALRRAFFEHSDGQIPSEVNVRRSAFALFIALAHGERWTDYSDDRFRRAIWSAWAGRSGHGLDRPTLAAWAALATTNLVHDAVTTLWMDAGPRLRAAAPVEGLHREAVSRLVAAMATGEVIAGKAAIVADPRMATAAFIERLALLGRSPEFVPEVHAAARSEATTLAGVTLLLSVLASLPPAEGLEPEFRAVASIDGEWQPSPLHLRRLLDEHLGASPGLGETTAWLMERLVLRPHEAIASSKLPDFTFRFRWDAGRLRFYDHPFNWVWPGNIRAWTLAQLTRDLGLAELRADGYEATEDGRRFLTGVNG